MSSVRSLPKRTPVAALLVLTCTISIALVARLARAAGDQLVSIAISPSRRAMAIGDIVAFHATGHFSSGITQDVTGTVRWSVSNPTVASIDPRGTAKGFALGSTRVTALDPPSGVGSPGAL